MSSYEEARAWLDREKAGFDREAEERRRAMDREARRWFWRDAAAFAAVLVASFALVTVAVQGLVWSAENAPGTAKARAACDAAVRALLETRDPLELQRADMLIRHLECGVRRRLPDATRPPS